MVLKSFEFLIYFLIKLFSKILLLSTHTHTHAHTDTLPSKTNFEHFYRLITLCSSIVK